MHTAQVLYMLHVCTSVCIASTRSLERSILSIYQDHSLSGRPYLLPNSVTKGVRIDGGLDSCFTLCYRRPLNPLGAACMYCVLTCAPALTTLRRPSFRRNLVIYNGLLEVACYVWFINEGIDGCRCDVDGVN